MVQPARWRARAVGLGLVVIASTACSSPQHDEAGEAAQRFAEAVDASDAETACALLAPATRRELEQSAGAPCSDAVMEEAKRAGGRGEVQVYGSMAQARYERDTLFLSRFDDRWLVVAAGCTRGSHAVHDCTIQGR
jgi:hypothetical protein